MTATDAGQSEPDEVWQRARAALEADQAQLEAQLNDLEPETSEMAYDDNFADSGQVAAEQGEYLAIASRLRDQLVDIEGALTRLDQGTYGRCEVCEEPIEPARLEAMPAARFCIRHAE